METRRALVQNVGSTNGTCAHPTPGGGGGGGGMKACSSNGMDSLKIPRRRRQGLGEVKIAVLGKTGVGKSAITVRFLTRRYIGEYDKTNESKYTYRTQVDGETVQFEVLDTGSKVVGGANREDCSRWADGFLLVYSITNWESFLAIKGLYNFTCEVKKTSRPPVVLVGNKADLGHFRRVPRREGEQQSGEFCCPFLEVSASENYRSIAEAFHVLYKEIASSKRRSRSFLDRAKDKMFARGRSFKT